MKKIFFMAQLNNLFLWILSLYLLPNPILYIA